MFGSLIKETRITASGVELEKYVQPPQNVWWKYPAKEDPKDSVSWANGTRRHPEEGLPATCVYTTGQVAKILGIQVLRSPAVRTEKRP